MNQFVDIHCHILPGVDDGSQSPEETKAMLEKAWDDGGDPSLSQAEREK